MQEAAANNLTASVRHLRALLVGVLMVSVAPLMWPNDAYAAPVQCECIRALREIQGLNVRGDAYTIPVTHSLNQATEGDVLLFDMGQPDHGAEIIGFEGQIAYGEYIAPRYIVVWTANWPTKCGISIERIEWNDARIKGVYRPLPLPSPSPSL